MLEKLTFSTAHCATSAITETRIIVHS